MKRFGLLSRVTEICAETGSKVVEEMGLGQKRALFHTLLDGCRRAVDMAGEDPKVREGCLGWVGRELRRREGAEGVLERGSGDAN